MCKLTTASQQSYIQVLDGGSWKHLVSVTAARCPHHKHVIRRIARRMHTPGSAESFVKGPFRATASGPISASGPIREKMLLRLKSWRVARKDAWLSHLQQLLDDEEAPEEGEEEAQKEQDEEVQFEDGMGPKGLGKVLTDSK